MFYLIIDLSGDQRISFSKTNQDICFGHTKPAVIPNYHLADYLKEYGNELVVNNKRDINYNWMPGQITIWEYLQNCHYGLRQMTMEQYIASHSN